MWECAGEEDVECVLEDTAAIAPANLSASADREDAVFLEWDYEVQYSTESLDDNDDWEAIAGQTLWEHQSAPSPLVEPGEASASTGAYATRVELAAQDFGAEPGAPLNYRVRAVNSIETGEPSEEAEGHVGVGDVEIDGVWMTYEIAGEAYQDTNAPKPEVEAGQASATHAEYVGHVSLEVEGYDAQPGDPVSYRVRGINEVGEGAATNVETGYIGVGEPEIQ